MKKGIQGRLGWAVLLPALIFAHYSWRVIPARHIFFSRLGPPGFGGSLLRLYIDALPFIGGLAYLFFSRLSWKPGKTGWPAFSVRGLGIQAGITLAILGCDYGAFWYFFRKSLLGWQFAADFAGTLLVHQIAGFLGALIAGLDQAREASEHQAEEHHLALLEAQGRLLAAQLDPHVWSNVASAAGCLISEAPGRAIELLEASSQWTRKVLESSKQPWATLGQERQLLEAYLHVQVFRFDAGRLLIEWAWDRSLDGLDLPPLLIQPLVENAIKHGIWPHPDGGRLRLEARRDGQQALIRIENAGCPLTTRQSAGGSGLENVRQRLRLAYGGRAAFVLSSAGLGTRAEIRIPLESPCAS